MASRLQRGARLVCGFFTGNMSGSTPGPCGSIFSAWRAPQGSGERTDGYKGGPTVPPFTSVLGLSGLTPACTSP